MLTFVKVHGIDLASFLMLFYGSTYLAVNNNRQEMK